MAPVAEQPDSSRQPVVITGLGVVSGFGWGRRAFWEGLRAGKTAIRDFDKFDHSAHRTHVASQVPVPGPRQPLARAEARRLSWADRYALAAVHEGLQHADLRLRSSGTEVGVFWGSSTGGMFEAEEFFAETHHRRTPDRARVSRLASHLNDSPAAAVARQFGVRGPVETVSSACATGSMAIGMGLQAIRAGVVDLALVGGADSLCRLTYAGFNSLRAVDAAPCRPFRSDREGLSLGEGAGALILEPLERALARGVRPIAQVAGFGASCDAHHMTAPDPEGSGAAHAIRVALEDAGLAAGAIDFVNAHGTGTKHNDRAEWNALLTVFGERARELPVTSTKGLLGHLLGSAGALEAVACVLCLQAREAHPTHGGTPLDPETPVDLVLDSPRPLPDARTVLSNSLGFGGANAAVIFARLPEDDA